MLVHGVKGSLQGSHGTGQHPQHCQHHPQDADTGGTWPQPPPPPRDTIEWGGGEGGGVGGRDHINIYIYIYVSSVLLEGSNIFSTFVQPGQNPSLRPASLG